MSRCLHCVLGKCLAAYHEVRPANAHADLRSIAQLAGELIAAAPAAERDALQRLFVVSLEAAVAEAVDDAEFAAEVLQFPTTRGVRGG